MSYIRFLYPYGQYHIYNRGIDKLDIFRDSNDKSMFIRQLHKSQSANNYVLYAYCIMSNHYHLLYKDVGKNMPTAIGTLQENYAKYYNSKYNHSGQVFENPFKSKPILNISHFFKIISYILNNPVQAKISSSYDEYAWSSSVSKTNNCNLVDFLYLDHLNIAYNDCTLDQYLKRNVTKNSLCDLEISRLSDSESLHIFNSITESISGLSSFNPNLISLEKQMKIIQESYYHGLSVRQLRLFSDKSYKFIRDNKDGLKYI